MKFKSDIEVQAGLRDGGNDIGAAGQLLSSTGTVTNWIDQADVVSAGATRVLIACKNTSGGTITKGTPVYQTGNVGATDVIEVAEADALISTGYLPAIGLLETDLINNAFGHVVITGELLNITTSPIDGVVPVTGDTIYLKSGGGLTPTKPTGEGNAIQNLGLVGKVSGGNAGSLTVASIMRQNDVPNLPEGRIWIGDGNTIVSDTVYVDEPNNRVGIGTISPQEKLHVMEEVPGATLIEVENTRTNSYAGIKLSSGQTNYNVAFTNPNGDFQIYNSSSNKEQITIAANGKVGIGTTSPNSKLQVDGEIDANGGDGYKINGKPWADESSNNLRLGDWDGEGFTTTIYDDTSAPVVIVKQSNVGIGTTSPSTVLEVSSSGVNGVDISQSASNASQSGRLFFTTNTASEGFALFNANGTLQMNSGGIPNDTSGTNRISIVGSSGNVGIGTTNPTAKLDVDGNLRLGTTGIFTITQSPFSTTAFYVAGGGNGGTITFGAPAATTQNVSVQGDLYSFQGSIGTKQFGSFNNKISYNGNNYLNSGNLGVGTTGPSSKLHVNGGVQLANDTASPSATKAGTFRYRTSGNNSYVDMCMQTGASTYAWVNIVTNSW